ncbi:MAG: ATP-dependent exoDNAse (exonuclease V) alpha subunit - helicase superfamily I member [uncultured Cytophagales bacterium]|uniref:ATP-dependent exoDNAse (Exonuclease V) alpha subunit - helicase superfamily I member n=1 Tax=uncultured Cytophagales bacterium TaxID=158755 RepID=A0A6J4HDX7_9SPHI|nr:MAG: ATP-dependent exoDNAse (exonuclease V) alpha subunit - helicase superfamily I member [uncultured Cytophagales bacterium]
MKRTFRIVCLLLFCCGFVSKDTYRHIRNNSFSRGEVLEFRIHYGFINAAEGVVEVHQNLFKINDRPCYRVNVNGKTIGAFDLVLRIRDTWRSYIDTAAMVPHRFSMDIQEGKYRKEETVFFNHEARTIRSEEVNKETKEFELKRNVQDLVSGYFYLRTVDFNQVRIGDIVQVDAFFDDDFYDFKVRYRGKGEVETKWGKIRCILLNPVMPANKLFKGENSIRVWVSDDENKIPIKVEADMFVGAVELDLKKHKNLRHPLKFY